MQAMKSTLSDRLPYLMLSAEDFSESFIDQKFQLVILHSVLFYIIVKSFETSLINL
jgi:hypothetical protein